MNGQQALKVLRELDDPNASVASTDDLDRQLAEARRRAGVRPATEVELGPDRSPRSRTRLTAALITAAVLVAGTVSVTAAVIDHHRATPGAGASPTGSGAQTEPPQVDQVTSTESVFSGQRDSLAPLNPADLTTMDIDDVITALRANGAGAGRFLLDPTILHVRAGLYTNPGLRGADGRPTVNVPAFVISGGQSTCDSSHKYTGQTGVPSTPQPCTATIIVDARTAQLLEIGEQWHS